MELRVCFDMRAFSDRCLHLELNQVFSVFLVIRLVMSDHVRLLHKHLSGALDPLMAGHNLFRGNDLGPFGQLDNVICF